MLVFALFPVFWVLEAAMASLDWAAAKALHQGRWVSKP